MVDPIKLTEALDKDAAYVLRKHADAEQHARNALEHKESAANEKRLEREARIEAGKRLIEVRASFADKAVSAKDGFPQWLKDNVIHTIHMATAYRYMQEAGYTEEQRAETRQKAAKQKRESRAREPKAFRIGWTEILVQRIGLRYKTGGSRNNMKKKLIAAGITVPEYFTDIAAADAFVLDYLRIFPDAPIEKPELSDSAKQKLERTLAVRMAQLERDMAAEKAKLHENHLKDVCEKARELIPKLTADYEKAIAENNEETARYHLLNNKAKKVISKDEYKKILFTLHGDRARCPHCDKPLDYTEIVQMILKLKAYAEA